MDEAQQKAPNTEKRKGFACPPCEDTGKVHLLFQGNGGNILREVPCPECQAGLHIAAGRDQAVKQLDERLQRLAWMVVIAIVLAGIALMAKGDGGHGHGLDAFARAVKEPVE